MSGALSKRQQARNEKLLAELVQTVPGNNICADCHARNPAWASWSLGVFLCMRCASIHRKLGTHISKVKSLSMDSWSNEQVDNMRKVGNVVSNQIYNPENKKPPVPVDVDEADSAMERWIRQKYTHNVANRTRNATSPRSDEGVPPPLPPKNSTSKFGLRSASSLFPLSSRSRKDSKSSSPIDPPRPSSHGSMGKASRMFGASVNYNEGDDTERKLDRLRDMGFRDSQRNAIVLKGVNGNLERAVESLVRLGEGDKPLPPPRDNVLRTSRSLTPLSSHAGGAGSPAVGLSVPAKPAQDQPASPGSVSTNPFDMISTPAQPQTAHSTGSLQNNNPYNQSLNPFGAPTQQTNQFTQAFQQLDISTNHQPQTLFPNRTGGLTPQGQNPPLYAQHMAPSAPSSPQFPQHMNFQNMTYPQPTPLQQQSTGYNPFFANQTNPMQHQPQQNLSINTQQPQPQPTFANNPFARSPTRIASPTSLGQIPEQSQSSFQNASSTYPQAGGNNPFFTSPAQTPTYVTQPYGQQQGYFQPQRQDNASIMALYSNMPATPQKSMSADAAQSLLTTSIPENPMGQSQPFAQPVQSSPQPLRSMTQPLPQSSSNNPFMNGGAAAAAAAAAPDPFSSQRHISRESVNLGKDMAWTNGRHSPDAFANLSARHG
ncbi:Protein gts1 [Amphichorda felina]